MEIKSKIFGSTAGKAAMSAGVVVAVLAILYFARDYFNRSPAGAASAERIFVCSETGKSFNHTLRVGDLVPVRSPSSGKNTGYPAELCNWTADGKVADKATPVLLNSYLGKSDPTFCPDCGRLVRGHNPAAEASRKPPPTRADYSPGRATEPARTD